MQKKIFIVMLFLFFLSFSVFAFNYWWMDVRIDDFKENDIETPSIQRVYFFKELQALQEATRQTNFRWIAHTRRPYVYQKTIYDTMRKEGFIFAIVPVNRYISRTRNQPSYWIYSIFALDINGVEYTDTIFREHNPLSF